MSKHNYPRACDNGGVSSTTSRGYGFKHMLRRKQLIKDFVPGTPCIRCGEPMFLEQKLDAAHWPHQPAAQGYLADHLEHAFCNRGSGARLQDYGFRRKPESTLPELNNSQEW